MDTLSQLRAGKLAGARRLDLSCGLEEVPPEVFDLADTLEVLNLTGNRLQSLPDHFARLQKLRILFCSENRFTHLPEVIGACPQLSMVGFKANAIETVADEALPSALRWLILTDNRIEVLPSSLGRCTSLQKLMLSGNRLRTLPASIAHCENLEMIRLAANEFEVLPSWLLSLPRLAWLALAGNPCAPAPALDSLPSAIDWNDLHLIDLLGEGASGFIHRAHWRSTECTQPREVAVKIFKGAMTSDGLPSCEVAASLTTGAHPNLIEILGRVVHHPSGAPGLVMALIPPEFTSLAGPPSFDSCTRDVYADDRSFTAEEALRIAQGLAAAAAHLHQHHVMHGDFYAHNVLTNRTGGCLLGDFGAASFCSSASGHALQQIEVRAFAYLLEELTSRLVTTKPSSACLHAMKTLQTECLSLDVASRPVFPEIQQRLAQLTADS